MVNIVRRYITESKTIYDHLETYCKNGDKNGEPNVLIMRKGDKCYKIRDWAYIPKKVLKEYVGRELSSDLGEKLLDEEKGKNHSGRKGRILFKNLRGRFILTSSVEHILEPKLDADIKIEEE